MCRFKNELEMSFETTFSKNHFDTEGNIFDTEGSKWRNIFDREQSGRFQGGSKYLHAGARASSDEHSSAPPH